MSAGGCAPNSVSKNSDGNQGTSWSYWDGKAWAAADIRVKCLLRVTEEHHASVSEEQVQTEVLSSWI